MNPRLTITEINLMSETRIKVKEAFRQLRKEGFIARANHLCCSNCAGYNLTEKATEDVELGKKKKEEIKGCVFWHNQDDESFNRRGILFLSFGNLHSQQIGDIGIGTLEVGKRVVEVLREKGLDVEWPEDTSIRIEVFAFRRLNDAA